MKNSSTRLIIADQLDYLGAMPNAKPKEVKLSKKAEDMIRFDLDNETETIQAYRQRVVQAEAIGHYALAELLRKIIAQEQDHQHDLATALGIEVPNVFKLGGVSFGGVGGKGFAAVATPAHPQ